MSFLNKNLKHPCDNKSLQQQLLTTSYLQDLKSDQVIRQHPCVLVHRDEGFLFNINCFVFVEVTQKQDFCFLVVGLQSGLDKGLSSVLLKEGRLLQHCYFEHTHTAILPQTMATHCGPFDFFPKNELIAVLFFSLNVNIQLQKTLGSSVASLS